MIRWKVVTLNRASICIIDQRYKRFYMKGKIVIAEPGTLGSFCFKTKKQAERFLLPGLNASNLILKVKPLSRGKVPKGICYPHCSSDFKDQKLHTMYPLQGTICYQKIKVLT